MWPQGSSSLLDHNKGGFMSPYQDGFQKERTTLAMLVLAGTAIAVVLAFIVS
jgi:hypothetical protein